MKNCIETSPGSLIRNAIQETDDAKWEIIRAKEQGIKYRRIRWNDNDFCKPTNEFLIDVLKKLHQLDDLLKLLDLAIIDDGKIELTVTGSDGYRKTILWGPLYTCPSSKDLSCSARNST